MQGLQDQQDKLLLEDFKFIKSRADFDKNFKQSKISVISLSLCFKASRFSVGLKKINYIYSKALKAILPTPVEE